MRPHFKIFLLLAVIVTATLLAPQAQQQADKKAKRDLSNFPVADSWTQESPDPIKREKRNLKSKKYNSRHSPRITESSDEIFTNSEWARGLAALPVENSDAVIVGDIVTAEAYVSDDHSEIYSEFVVRISKVLKDAGTTPINDVDSIIVERSGGRLRLPSGKVVVSSTSNQDMPRVGSRYVLFLTHLSANGGSYENDFHILTGYELRGGKVFPLDKLASKHPINTYAGADEASFLRELSSALAHSEVESGLCFFRGESADRRSVGE